MSKVIQVKLQITAAKNPHMVLFIFHFTLVSIVVTGGFHVLTESYEFWQLALLVGSHPAFIICSVARDDHT